MFAKPAKLTKLGWGQGEFPTEMGNSSQPERPALDNKTTWTVDRVETARYDRSRAPLTTDPAPEPLGAENPRAHSRTFLGGEIPCPDPRGTGAR
jgi:hypothetical protein